MAIKNISIIDAIKFGYSKTIEHFSLLFMAYALRLVISLCISLLVNYSLGYIQNGLSTGLVSYIHVLQIGFAGFSLSIFNAIIYYVITLGLTHISLNIYDGKKSSVYALLYDWRLILNYLTALFLFWITLLLCSSAFIISAAVIIMTKQYVSFLGASALIGIILGLIAVILLVSFRAGFFLDQIIVDKSVGPVDALKINFKMTRGVSLNLIALWFLSSCLILLSSLTILGIIITVPAYLLTRTYAYRKLSK